MWCRYHLYNYIPVYFSPTHVAYWTFSIKVNDCSKPHHFVHTLDNNGPTKTRFNLPRKSDHLIVESHCVHTRTLQQLQPDVNY